MLFGAVCPATAPKVTASEMANSTAFPAFGPTQATDMAMEILATSPNTAKVTEVMALSLAQDTASLAVAVLATLSLVLLEELASVSAQAVVRGLLVSRAAELPADPPEPVPALVPDRSDVLTSLWLKTPIC